MKAICVVYFSGFGHTARQAGAAIEGPASVPDVEASAIVIDAEGQVQDEAWTQLAAADAIVFGCPTCMGNIPWQFKRFADASSKAWFARHGRDKFAAGFTDSGAMNGDKQSTLNYLFTLSMQHAMLWFGSDLMPANTLAAQRDDVNYLAPSPVRWPSLRWMPRSRTHRPPATCRPHACSASG